MSNRRQRQLETLETLETRYTNFVDQLLDALTIQDITNGTPVRTELKNTLLIQIRTGGLGLAEQEQLQNLLQQDQALMAQSQPNTAFGRAIGSNRQLKALWNEFILGLGKMQGLIVLKKINNVAEIPATLIRLLNNKINSVNEILATNLAPEAQTGGYNSKDNIYKQKYLIYKLKNKIIETKIN